MTGQHAPEQGSGTDSTTTARISLDTTTVEVTAQETTNINDQRVLRLTSDNTHHHMETIPLGTKGERVTPRRTTADWAVVASLELGYSVAGDHAAETVPHWWLKQQSATAQSARRQKYIALTIGGGLFGALVLPTPLQSLSLVVRLLMVVLAFVCFFIAGRLSHEYTYMTREELLEGLDGTETYIPTPH